MLTTHIYLNGQCKDAINLYKSAFDASVQTMIEDSESRHVVHAEILIHGQTLIMNDFGNNDGPSISGGYQLSVQFENETDLQKAYTIMQEGSAIINPMQATDYSPCVIRFTDRFDVRWAFWV